MTDILTTQLEEKGVKVVTGAKIEAFVGDTKVEAVKTDQAEYPVELVIQAAGVVANTEWLKG